MIIPAAKPTITALEANYVKNAVDSGQISLGSFNTSVEEKLESFYEGLHSLLVTNGTDAIHLALLAIGIGPGDEVIVPNLTYIAVANAVSYCGATPIFCDVVESNWCINYKNIENLVTNKTRAIIVVNSYGGTIDWDDFEPIRRRIGLPVIEDNAEGILGLFTKKQFGTFGDISTFSFYGNKLLTSGEGGAVLTRHKGLHEKMKLLRGQGMDPSKRFYFTVIGHNFRMTNLQAAMLSAQWERKNEILGKLNSHCEIYTSLLADSIEQKIIKLQELHPKIARSPWFFSILFKDSNSKNVAEFLSSNGVETRPFFIPLTQLPPYYKENSSREFPVSTKLHTEGLSLPLFYDLTAEQITYICNLLTEFFRVSK